MEAIRCNPAESLSSGILAIKGLSLTSKRVYSLIDYCGQGRSCSLAISWIASRLGLSRQAVSRAAGQLQEAELIKMQQFPRKLTSFSIRKALPKKFFLFVYGSDSGHTVSSTVLYEYLKFRQGGNDAAWPHLETIALDLGLSKRQIVSAVAELEQGGFIQVKHAHGGIKQGNRYALTGKSFYVTQMHSKSESGVQKCNTNNNTSVELKKNNPVSIAPHELSAKRRLLVDEGVAWPVAESLAKAHSQEDLENAILNAHGQRKLKSDHGGRLNMPAYIVATLNQSRREGHAVRLNRFMAGQKAAWIASKQRRPITEQLSAAHVQAAKRRALSPAVLKALGLPQDKIAAIQNGLGEVA